MRRRKRANDPVPPPSAVAQPLAAAIDSVELAGGAPPDGPRSDTETYPTILREYASSGVREVRTPVVHRERRPSGYRRMGVDRARAHEERAEGENERERYGELGPYWQRRG